MRFVYIPKQFLFIIKNISTWKISIIYMY